MVKTKGYAHTSTNPAGKPADRRARAAAVQERCLREHPRTEDGRCAREER